MNSVIESNHANHNTESNRASQTPRAAAVDAEDGVMDKCFSCGLFTMPRIEEGSKVTARACQNPDCRAVEYGAVQFPGNQQASEIGAQGETKA
jgi:hypothetical protein